MVEKGDAPLSFNEFALSQGFDGGHLALIMKRSPDLRPLYDAFLELKAKNSPNNPEKIQEKRKADKEILKRAVRHAIANDKPYHYSALMDDPDIELPKGYEFKPARALLSEVLAEMGIPPSGRKRRLRKNI